MFLGNNPMVDGLHCTLVESVKERAFLSVSRRHIVWFVTQDHSTGETKNLSMDGVYRVYHGNSFGFSLMLGNNGALSDWWQIIYSLSIFLFLLPILLQYLLPSFFLLWSEKKKALHCPTPWCSTLIHSQQSFHSFIKSIIRMGTTFQLYWDFKPSRCPNLSEIDN